MYVCIQSSFFCLIFRFFFNVTFVICLQTLFIFWFMTHFSFLIPSLKKCIQNRAFKGDLSTFLIVCCVKMWVWNMYITVLHGAEHLLCLRLSVLGLCFGFAYKYLHCIFFFFGYRLLFLIINNLVLLVYFDIY